MDMADTCFKKDALRLTEKEAKLIQIIRDVKFGELTLHVADGNPVRIEEVRKSIKL